MSFSVEITGLKELQAKFAQLPEKLKTRINAQIQRGAEVFVERAAKDAPKDTGLLQNGISFFPNPVNNLNVTLSSNAEYSAYQEFGTITNVFKGYATSITGLLGDVNPEAILAYAATFKGKGIRKTGGIFPHPFFFKQLPIAKKAIEEGIAAELSKL